jgi:hypothetical protein
MGAAGGFRLIDEIVAFVQYRSQIRWLVTKRIAAKGE